MLCHRRYATKSKGRRGAVKFSPKKRPTSTIAGSPCRAGADVLLLAEVSPWLVVTHLSPALMMLLLTGLLLATGLGLVAVAMIAGITTRPVRELTAAIKSDPRPDPLPHLEKQDEVGTLASAMDTALGNLQEALARERAFTRDVSHELRTPLTTLRNALTLMPRSAESDPHLSQLRNSSNEVERTLASLLALARAESAVLEPMKLRPLLETLLLERSRILESRGFDLNIEVPDAAQVQGNAQLTKLLLANLLDNALHYAEPPRLDISLLHDRLVLENPVRDEFVPPHSESLKHGLALSERLAEAQNCRLEIGTAQCLFRAVVDWR